jgi:ElaB/YqjD/DUF883 family membrane-anchored ribosome-binding protein
MTKSHVRTGTDKIREALELIKDASQQKREDLSDTVDGIYDKVVDAKDMAADKVKLAAKTVNGSAHKKPWHYMGGAAVLGFLAGIFARSRR